MPRRLTLRHHPNDARTQAALDQIERRRPTARARVPEAYERYFQDQARFLSAHSTVSIEGNQLDFQSLQTALIDERGDDPNRRKRETPARPTTSPPIWRLIPRCALIRG